MLKYKSILLLSGDYRHEEKTHLSLKSAQKYILTSIKPGTHRAAWIIRSDGGKERKLPGQYEVHKMGSKTGLYRRMNRPNRLVMKPVMTL